MEKAMHGGQHRKHVYGIYYTDLKCSPENQTHTNPNEATILSKSTELYPWIKKNKDKTTLFSEGWWHWQETPTLS